MKKTAKELDELFDSGEDMTPYVDMSSIRRPNLETKRVNIDFPQWVVRRLDQQSKLLGVTRQALVKMWIAERLEKV
jgi:hypothetical protein